MLRTHSTGLILGVTADALHTLSMCIHYSIDISSHCQITHNECVLFKSRSL